MRIAVLGPTHPYKGGVAVHTTRTAGALADAGHDVELVSWSRLLPDALYPGEEAQPGGEPEAEFDRTVRPLHWNSPRSWWRTGRLLRDRDLLVVVFVVPVQVPTLLALLRAARGSGASAGSRARGRAGPEVVVLVHNVLPHERHPGDAWLVGRLLRAGDRVLVHSPAMARQAAALGAREVAVAGLPPHLPGGEPDPQERDGFLRVRRERRAVEPGVLRVLALGMVRPYKGIDLLLEAARAVPGVRVTVAGEHWGRAGERVAALAQDPALARRVHRIPGYVPAGRVRDLLAEHDVLVLPYRHATASQNVLLAHAAGMPVLATRVGTFPAQVRDGVDGVLVEPADVDALEAGLRRLSDADELARLESGVPQIDLQAPWRRYVRALTGARTASRAEALDGVGSLS